MNASHSSPYGASAGVDATSDKLSAKERVIDLAQETIVVTTTTTVTQHDHTTGVTVADVSITFGFRGPLVGDQQATTCSCLMQLKPPSDWYSCLARACKWFKRPWPTNLLQLPTLAVL